jgi:hypothetical protein
MGGYFHNHKIPFYQHAQMKKKEEQTGVIGSKSQLTLEVEVGTINV